MSDMSADNQFALAAFQQAREHFTQRRFAEARRVMADYRRLIQYQAFRHADRRPIKGLPTCSVIIVSHAAGDGLLKCLDTILAQRHSAFEVILIDNGGNEALLPVLQRKPILHVLCPMNLLPSEARNVGAYFARGPVLVFVDDDGQVCQGYLRQAEQALRIPQVIGVRGRILPLTSEGASNSHYDLGLKSKPAAFNLEGNMAIRRGVFRAAGGFDPLMFGHEGHELTERCQRLDPSFQVRYWPELLLYHDFAQGTRLQAKRERQRLGSDYKAFLKKLYSYFFNRLTRESRVGGTHVSQAGISIILRAGNNMQAAKKFLEQLDRINTYKPVEVVVLFNKPEKTHLSLVREVAGRLSIIVLPAENRTFSSVIPKLRYDQALIVSTPIEISQDCLGAVSRKLRTGSVKKIELKAPGLNAALLVTSQYLDHISALAVVAGKSMLAQALDASDTAQAGMTSVQKQSENMLFQSQWREVPLDTQISALESELLSLDKQLSDRYQTIEKLDAQYERLPGGSKEAEKLKQQLKVLVFESNETLKRLKHKHDDLESLRIRRYSVGE